MPWCGASPSAELLKASERARTDFLRVPLVDLCTASGWCAQLDVMHESRFHGLPVPPALEQTATTFLSTRTFGSKVLFTHDRVSTVVVKLAVSEAHNFEIDLEHDTLREISCKTASTTTSSRRSFGQLARRVLWTSQPFTVSLGTGARIRALVQQRVSAGFDARVRDGIWFHRALTRRRILNDTSAALVASREFTDWALFIGSSGWVPDLQVLVAPSGTVWLVDPAGWMAGPAAADSRNDSSGGGGGGSEGGEGKPRLLLRPRESSGREFNHYVSRRQSVAMLSLSLACALVAAGMEFMLTELLCAASCSVGCTLAAGAPRGVRAALTTYSHAHLSEQASEAIAWARRVVELLDEASGSSTPPAAGEGQPSHLTATASSIASTSASTPAPSSAPALSQLAAVSARAGALSQALEDEQAAVGGLPPAAGECNVCASQASMHTIALRDLSPRQADVSKCQSLPCTWLPSRPSSRPCMFACVAPYAAQYRTRISMEAKKNPCPPPWGGGRRFDLGGGGQLIFCEKNGLPFPRGLGETARRTVRTFGTNQQHVTRRALAARTSQRATRRAPRSCAT